VSCSQCEGQELNLGVSLILLSRCKQQVAALFDLYANSDFVLAQYKFLLMYHLMVKLFLA
jgi:hypothetical protein